MMTTPFGLALPAATEDETEEVNLMDGISIEQNAEFWNTVEETEI